MTLADLLALAQATLEHSRAKPPRCFWCKTATMVDGHCSKCGANQTVDVAYPSNAAPQLAAVAMVLCEQLEWHEAEAARWLAMHDEMKADGNEVYFIAFARHDEHAHSAGRLRAVIAKIGGAQ